MRMTGLSLDNIPPLSVPLGFFRVAPLFGFSAALLLILSPELLSQRWHPSLLAATHLLTLGFMAMVMLGALFQVLPVISSHSIPAATQAAPWIRVLLGSGTVVLAASLGTSAHAWLPLAMTLLVCGLGLFLLLLGVGLIKARQAGESVLAIRYAALSLAIASGFGIMQIFGYTMPSWVSYSPLTTDIHAGWGLAGWALLLVMGVSFQVIPMFHVAPAFPRWCRKGLPPVLFICLLASTLLPQDALWQQLGLLGIVSSALLFSANACQVLRQRKRKIRDETVRFWYLALFNLGLAALLALLTLTPLQRLPLAYWSGVVFIAGFALSVIFGMLQKIVPFLIYLHLQRACLTNPMALASLPTMKALLPSTRAAVQFNLHCAVLVSLYLAVTTPLPAFIAGALMAADFAWLFVSIQQATRKYQASLETLA